MVDLDETAMAALARDLVLNIRSYKDTFAEFGIDENDYQQIEKNEFFRKVRDHIALEWNSIHSSEERNRFIQLAFYEKLSPVLVGRAMREDTNLSAAVDVAKMVMKGAGIGETKSEKANTERFVISINLGGDVETYNKSIEINPNDTPPESSNGQTVNAKPKEPALQFIRPPGQGEGSTG